MDFAEQFFDLLAHPEAYAAKFAALKELEASTEEKLKARDDWRKVDAALSQAQAKLSEASSIKEAGLRTLEAARQQAEEILLNAKENASQSEQALEDRSSFLANFASELLHREKDLIARETALASREDKIKEDAVLNAKESLDLMRLRAMLEGKSALLKQAIQEAS